VLHSFPTRRSSDLAKAQVEAARQETRTLIGDSIRGG
jgi:hypothetical protein